MIILAFLFVVGAAMGSFVCCQARRLRLKEKGKERLGDRSVCLSCGYQLKWFDNIPILSWLFLGGRCRKCRKKIGVVEFLAEIGFAVVFLLIGVSVGNFDEFVWIDWVSLFATLVFVTGLGFLAIYDGMWGELPTVGLTFSVVCGIILLVLKQWKLFLGAQNFEFLWGSLGSAVVGVGILAGVYFLLYMFSRGKWVGSGDWILGLAIALALGDWWLALLVMFISNVLAVIVMLPVSIKKKKARIYFGPWMVVGYVIVLVGMKVFVNVF